MDLVVFLLLRYAENEIWDTPSPLVTKSTNRKISFIWVVTKSQTPSPLKCERNKGPFIKDVQLLGGGGYKFWTLFGEKKNFV